MATSSANLETADLADVRDLERHLPPRRKKPRNGDPLGVELQWYYNDSPRELRLSSSFDAMQFAIQVGPHHESAPRDHTTEGNVESAKRQRRIRSALLVVGAMHETILRAYYTYASHRCGLHFDYLAAVVLGGSPARGAYDRAAERDRRKEQAGKLKGRASVATLTLDQWLAEPHERGGPAKDTVTALRTEARGLVVAARDAFQGAWDATIPDKRRSTLSVVTCDGS